MSAKRKATANAWSTPEGSKRSRTTAGRNTNDSDGSDNGFELEHARGRRGGFRGDVYDSDDEADLVYDPSAQGSGQGMAQSNRLAMTNVGQNDDDDDDDLVGDVTAEDGSAGNGPANGGAGALPGFTLDADDYVRDTHEMAEAHRARALKQSQRIASSQSTSNAARRDVLAMAMGDAQDYAYQPHHQGQHRLGGMQDGPQVNRQITTDNGVQSNDNTNTNSMDDDEDDMFAPPVRSSTTAKGKQPFGAQDTVKPLTIEASASRRVVGQDAASQDIYDDKGEQVVEAFNMKADLEEGDIDEEGNFVRKARDPMAFHDQWLDEVSRADIEQARLAHQRQTLEIKERDQQEEVRLRSTSKSEILRQLVNLMQPREAVLQALARWGKVARPKRKLQAKRAKTTGPSTSNAPEDSATAMAEARQAIEAMTDLSDRLMALGVVQIYEMSYEQIIRQLRLQDIVPDDWVPGTYLGSATTDMPTDAPTKQSPSLAMVSTISPTSEWEYKYTPDLTAEIYGPYPWADIQSWHQQGYFDGQTLVRPTKPTEASKPDFQPLQSVLSDS
ncbi:hypothetical protein H4R35_001106 [Dimargaris xerosporica]|nr:hypothetical protein H4R35_001106 [Dimargaris xerosporica]